MSNPTANIICQKGVFPYGHIIQCPELSDQTIYKIFVLVILLHLKVS